MAFQMGSGLLDFLVLAILGGGDTYGYVLTQRVRGMMDISDSTLYPVLRRLQKDGALATYDQPYQGRNRRYYSITPYGRNLLSYYVAEWQTFKKDMDIILTGGAEHD